MIVHVSSSSSNSSSERSYSNTNIFVWNYGVISTLRWELGNNKRTGWVDVDMVLTLYGLVATDEWFSLNTLLD